MNISRVVVRNLRSIELADIKLSPGLNVLVGENGSGKSTALYAIRLAIDNDLITRSASVLTEDDFYRRHNKSSRSHVLVSVEFENFTEGNEDQKLRQDLMAHSTVRRATYRFRPNSHIRPSLFQDENASTPVSLKDYVVERRRGGVEDPIDVKWDTNYGEKLDGSVLNGYNIVEVPALRNVVQDLRSQRLSPLARLFEETDFTPETQTQLLNALQAANSEIETTEHFKLLAQEIGTAYRDLAGHISDLKVRLGFSEPTFASILRGLNLFVSDEMLSESFELSRNGLGYNNVLYIAMLIRLFAKRSHLDESPQLLLIEEPEAHLHPQAQEALIRRLKESKFQSIVTTHSAHVLVAAGLDSVVTFRRGSASTAVRLIDNSKLTRRESDDLERYMDATRSSLLFAKAVILVEGPSEQSLIREYAANMEKDLVQCGVQVVAINGIHFHVFEKLLGPDGIDRTFVRVSDGDEKPSPDSDVNEADDGADICRDGRTFKTKTTLERAITQQNSLDAIRYAAEELGLVGLKNAIVKSAGSAIDLFALQSTVLLAAEGVGKARFAQALARQIRIHRVLPPPYIASAIEAVTRAQRRAT